MGPVIKASFSNTLQTEISNTKEEVQENQRMLDKRIEINSEQVFRWVQPAPVSFDCHICPKSYCYKKHLNRHIRSHHAYTMPVGPVQSVESLKVTLDLNVETSEDASPVSDSQPENVTIKEER